MFYETATNNHGLRHNPLKAIVAPRPIGWITSMSAKGEINLAPYSFFNAVSDDPPIVLFSSEGPKDSLVFVRRVTGSSAQSQRAHQIEIKRFFCFTERSNSSRN